MCTLEKSPKWYLNLWWHNRNKEIEFLTSDQRNEKVVTGGLHIKHLLTILSK
jgi:hypothetical protein